MFIPIARPRSPGSNTEVMIARLVPKIIELDNPWNTRSIINEVILCEKMMSEVEIVNRNIPSEKIFFLPIISANLPNGNRNIADERIKLLITHPS